MELVTTLLTVPPDNDMEARLALAALLEDALDRADNLGENLVGAHISQALETLRKRS
jgi:hypothetical protein